MNEYLEKLRSFSFWKLDALRGKSVKRHYENIKFINESYNSEESNLMRKNALEKALKHAIQTVPYYAKNEPTLLSKFPVVNKNIIRDNFSEFQSNIYKDKKRYEVETSGSTGTPFRTYHNTNKKNRNTADTIYFAERSGFKLGYQLFFIRLWGGMHTKSKFSAWSQNMIGHDITDLSDASISKLLDKMKNNNSNIGIIAYASAFDAIGQYLDKHNSGPLNYNIKSIIGVAESLSTYAKESTKKYFGISAISRYSNIENGILAQQDEDNDNFFINWASYYIEILSLDSDTPVEYGETGRIVVTDLYNHSVPMIRYDTGDLGTIIIESESNRPVLSKVEGRKMDVLYTTKGERIAGHIVHLICMNKEIKQYQLIQEGKVNYTFKINTSSGKIDEEYIITTYKKFLGDDAIIKIEYVDDIPLLSSGKRKKVVNKYYS